MQKLQVHFKKYFNSKLNRWLSIFAFIFLVLSSLSFLRSNAVTKTYLTDDVLLRKQVIARSGAQSFQNLIDVAGKSLVLLAESQNIQAIDPNAHIELNEFIRNWSNTPISGIALIDKKGIIRINSNRTDVSTTGISVSERDYFIKSINSPEGTLYYGAPVISKAGPNIGKSVLPISTPLFHNGKISGVISTGLLIEDVAQQYIEPLKTSEATDFYIIGDDGLFWYSSRPEFTGKNMYELLNSAPQTTSQATKNSITTMLTSKKEGSQVLTLGNAKNSQTLILAYNPVIVQNLSAKLIVAIPEKEALIHLPDFESTFIRRYAFIVLFILAFSLLTIVGVRLVQKEAYQEGFSDGRDYVNRNK